MRLLCEVSYKGTNYQGWQKQPNAPTIQETIEKVLSQILNTEISIYGSGRTDAGVHAINQYFHFDIEKDTDLGRLRYSANCLLPDDIFISDIKVVSDDFHARFSAKTKTYSYLIRLGERNPFDYELTTNIPYDIDINLLSDILKEFVGEHDFKDFTSKEEDDNSFVRQVISVDVTFKAESNQFVITLTGNGFMRYQIRNMVGSAIAVAAGKENENYIYYHLSDKKEREIVSYKADPQGLYLVDVLY